MQRVYRYLILLLLLVSIPVFSTAAPDEMPADKLAMIAALDFLELADKGDFEQCWINSSQFFRKKIDKTAWVQDISHMRPQYGEHLSRSLQFSKPLDVSLEMIEQPSIFLIFRTSFAEKTVAEMLTLSKDSDKQWRVAGYSIQ